MRLKTVSFLDKEISHLMFNKKGTGLTDGTLEEQTRATEKIKARGAGF